MEQGERQSMIIEWKMRKLKEKNDEISARE